MVAHKALLRSWLKVSFQSFGGGTATLALMRAEFVDRQKWVPESQFLRDWALCQLAPGINLIAMTILIGKRLAGWLGVLTSLAGMLLPSFAITVLLAALYAQFVHTAVVSHAMLGLMPGVAAVGLATSFLMGKPIYMSLREQGWARLAFFGVLFAAAMGVEALGRVPIALIVLRGGAAGAIFNSIWERRSTLTFFVMVLRSALLSSGGFANIPMLHDDLVPRGLATDTTFAQSMAVAQVSPGPNGLWVVCLGYFVGGWSSALAALVAITIPPLLVLAIQKLYERHRKHPAVEGFMRGLEISVIAVFAVVMVRFLQGSAETWLTPAVAIVAFALAISARVPIVAILVLAGLAGVVVHP